MSTKRRTKKKATKKKATQRKASKKKATKKKATKRKATKKKAAKKKATKRKASKKKAAKKKATKRKATKKKAAKKKATQRKATKKKATKKKATQRKATKKKAAKKKATQRKATKKKATKKKATQRKASKKKATKKKATQRKASKKKATQRTAAKKAVPKKTARTKGPRIVPAEATTPENVAPVEPKVTTAAPQPATETPTVKSEAQKPRTVLRIAGGRNRAPKKGGAKPQNGLARHANGKAGVFSPRLELNPRVQSTRGQVAAPPKNEGADAKPMTVAEKRRAEAEAMFKQFVKPGAQEPAAEPEPRDEYGGGRVSKRDSLTTMLRMAEHPSQAMSAAQELADRFQLPPDQGLLLKIIDLGDERLTKLALEELLELDDRGRVRATDHLRNTLGGLHSADHETEELKDLLLAKIGVAG